jgi:hypothetical protein
MDRKAYSHLVCRMTPGLYLAAIFIVTGPAAGAEPPAQGTLSGTVLDPDGAPVKGARVWVNTTDQCAMAQAHTEGDGRFRLGPLRPVYRNTFDLLVDAPGFARQYVGRGSYSVYSGIDADLGTIQVERGGVFTGRVLDADGTPAALFDGLHYTYDHLKIRQHVSAICEWELGRSGKALAIWRELLHGFEEMGMTREAALVRVDDVATNAHVTDGVQTAPHLHGFANRGSRPAHHGHEGPWQPRGEAIAL